MKRSAAPFQLQTQPLPALQSLMAVTGSLAVLSLTLALAAHFPAFWPLLVLSPLGALLAWRCTAIAPRMLRWDGQQWHLYERSRGSESFSPSPDEPAPVHLTVVFDLGFALLLRVDRRPNGWSEPTYLPLTRSTQGPQWGALRAVLYSARQSPG
ncbi:hypothetical protein [Roseateles albus]|uniref:Toxin CptA n=1 Tax=Roseateles albus TaxID=2987525 RepID=A0ABT5KGU6_9BURK|nr:hypothetical protein [Roseateles albus]MDC8772759.1 hypothetical protein [Roseateles albus]